MCGTSDDGALALALASRMHAENLSARAGKFVIARDECRSGLRLLAERMLALNVPNVLCYRHTNQSLKQFYGKMDAVVLDNRRYSTNTAALAKFPEQKQRIEHGSILEYYRWELKEELMLAKTFAKEKDGFIIFVSRSVLKCDTLDVSQWAEDYSHLQRIGEPFQAYPDSAGRSGCFIVVFQKPRDTRSAWDQYAISPRAGVLEREK